MKHRLLIVGCTAFYIGALCWAYDAISHAYFEYHCFWNRGPQTSEVLRQAFIALIPSCWVSYTFSRPSHLLLSFLYFFVAIPTAIVPSFMFPGRDAVLYFSLFVLVSMLLLELVHFLPARNLFRPELTVQSYEILLVGLFLGLNCLVVLTYGFRFEYLSIWDIYELRLSLPPPQSTLERVGAYGVGWTANIVNPLLMAWGLTYRKPLFFVPSMLDQVLLYLTTGDKITLFAIAFVVGLVLILRHQPSRRGLMIILVPIVTLVLGMAEFLAFDSCMFYGLVPHRLTMTPGMLSGLYLDTFADQEKLYMANSPFNFVTKGSRQALPVGQIIGIDYYGSEDTCANANLWADGFANFGYFGVLFASAVLFGMLQLFNRLSADRNVVVCAATLGVPAINLANEGVQTVLCSHGFALLLLLIFLMPSAEQTNYLAPVDEG